MRTAASACPGQLAFPGHPSRHCSFYYNCKNMIWYKTLNMTWSNFSSTTCFLTLFHICLLKTCELRNRCILGSSAVYGHILSRSVIDLGDSCSCFDLYHNDYNYHDGHDNHGGLDSPYHHVSGSLAVRCEGDFEFSDAHGSHCRAYLDPCVELAAENNRDADISDIRVCRVSFLLYNCQTDSDDPGAHHSHGRGTHPPQASLETLDHIYTE